MAAQDAVGASAFAWRQVGAHAARQADLEDAISGRLEPPFDELVYAHLQAAQMLNGSHLDDAHGVQCTYCKYPLIPHSTARGRLVACCPLLLLFCTRFAP